MPFVRSSLTSRRRGSDDYDEIRQEFTRIYDEIPNIELFQQPALLSYHTLNTATREPPSLYASTTETTAEISNYTGGKTRDENDPDRTVATAGLYNDGEEHSSRLMADSY